MLRNFRFLIPEKLAGMAHPGSGDVLVDSLEALRDNGIGAIVSLEEEGLANDVLARHGFAYRHYPIDDFGAPTLAQASDFVEFVDEQIDRGHGVAAHCWAGIGRTGTMLACYLIWRGESATVATRKIRLWGGIESSDQVSFLIEFEAVCRSEKEEPDTDETEDEEKD